MTHRPDDDARWPAIADRLPPGPAYLAGTVTVKRLTVRRPSPYETGLWLTDDGILLGHPHVRTRLHSPLGDPDKADWHRRTTDPVTADHAAERAAAHAYGAWLPWGRIVDASIVEHAGYADVRFVLDDGEEVVRKRHAGDAGLAADNAWRVLLARLVQHVPAAHVRQFTRADLRWRHHAARVALVAVPVLFLALVVANGYVERRLLDAPRERWVAGHYDTDDPVAHVYAHTAEVLPVPLWLAEDGDEMWVVDHDRIVTTRTAEGRFSSSTTCWLYSRDGRTLSLSALSRSWPCHHPDTGEELDGADRVDVRGWLERHTEGRS